eukprot:2621915-Alexandrium_andersonii.AAC.1
MEKKQDSHEGRIQSEMESMNNNLRAADEKVHTQEIKISRLTEKVARLEDDEKERQIDLATRQIKAFGWHGEDRDERQKCVERWMKAK